MKKLTYILLMLLVLAACTGTSRNPQLVAVDSLLLSRPDSALTLLRSMNISSTSDRMYYYLLLADACNKCYDTLPSDSILQEVAEYYDRHGNPNEQVRAHYLLGCAYRDLGEAPHALDCYHTAISRADTLSPDCNFRLLMSVYGQMAEIFHKQNLPQDEIEMSRKYGYYARVIHDTLDYVRNIEVSVKAYGILGDTTKVMELINESKRLYLQLGYPYLAIRENSIPIYYCIQKGNLEEARILMEEYEHESKLFDKEGFIAKGRESYYYIKGLFFQKLNQLDSAEYYMRRVLKFGNKTDAYRGLLSVYNKKANTDSITYFVQQYEESIDSLNAKKQIETIHQTATMYNYHRFQQMANNEILAAERARTNSFIILGMSLVAFICVFFTYKQYRKKKQDEIQQLEKDYGQSVFEFNKISAELNRQKQKSSDLLKAKKEQVELLKEKIRNFHEKQKNNSSSINLSEFKEKKIVLLFMKIAKESYKYPLPTEKEWDSLIRQFSRVVPSAFSAIGREIILSRTELKLCILLLLGFNLTDITVLLNTTSQSVSNIKTKANLKLFEENSAVTLERNLMKTVGMV